MSKKPFFHEELQFLRYTDSSNSGPTVTFALTDRDLLNVFVGAKGKRFACVLIEIGDDEQPVEAPPAAAPPKPAHPKGGHLAREAGILCNDRAFQRQIELDYPRLWGEALALYDAGDLAKCAADVVRRVCGVNSRAELDHDIDAANKFKSCFWHKWIEAEQGI